MEKLPNNSNYTVRSNSVVIDNNKIKNICYFISKNGKIITEIEVKLPVIGRPEESEKIVKQNNKFVNGYKVVKISNGEYSYIREFDKLLLPYRYDIVFDFNQYGYAIACKDGNVTWIDKNFNYLDINGDFIKDTPNSNWSKNNVWQGVTSFSEGKIPLSLVYNGRSIYKKAAYLGIDGKLKQFYRYDGKKTNSISHSIFTDGTCFDESGTAIADNYILFDKGYYMLYKDLIQICKQKGLMSKIIEDAEKYFDQPKIKKLINNKKT